MVRTEFFKNTKEMTLVKTYSDAGMLIQQEGTGALYDVAIDPDFMNRTYTETDIPIGQDVWEDPEEEDVPPEVTEPPEEGEVPEEVGVPEEVTEDAEPKDADGPVPISEELV